MCSDCDARAISRKAEGQEDRYEWGCAARSYEQMLHSESITDFSAAAAWEKIGSCYSRASRQTEDSKEFQRLAKQAVQAYRNAARLLEKEDDPQGRGMSARCNAIAEYLRSWLVTGPLEKRKALDECRTFGEKSLKAYEDAGDQLSCGKMCNDLLLCLLERLYVASDSTEMQKFAEEGQNCGNKAIAVLSKVGDKRELLRAYSLASLQTWYAANISEPEDKEKLARKNLRYSEKALELSREVDDPYCVALSDWAAALCTLFFTRKAESSLQYAEAMLRQGMTLKDNYVKGVAHYHLALVTNWTALREEDPGRKKEEYEEIIRHAQEAIRCLRVISQDLLIAQTYQYYAESYMSLARDFEAGSREKRALLEKAVMTGRKGLDHAVRSGSPDATGSTLHALSKALHFYSDLKTSGDEKRILLEEALTHRREYSNIVERAFPSNIWIRGVGKNYEGLIEAELAKVEKDEDKKRALLESAASTMEQAVSHCRKWVSSNPIPAPITATGTYCDAFGETLEDLYVLSGDKGKLERAIEAHHEAAEEFKKVDLRSRVAESYWKMARNQDRLEMYSEAAGNFENASAEYRTAAQRTDHLRGFYSDYASYMTAWSETEKAKFAHKNDDHATAMKHYREAADILKPSKLWNYMSPNFLAWSFLEKAEDLGRKGRAAESVGGFREAADAFGETKEVLRAELDRIRDSDEIDLANKLIMTSDMREEYCMGRIALEEAKILDGQGDHLGSSQKYGSAAQKFQRAIDLAGHELDRRDLRPLACLCRGWQLMLQAEAEASPELYLEASRLFDEAKECSLNEKGKLLALGHSAFCKALETGSRFEATRDTRLHSDVTHHLESAANYYIRAGVETASEYAKATQRLFDAYVYMDEAKDELDPEKKTRYYMMAEKVLQTSASSYVKAEHPEKREEVRRLLEAVKEERRLAMSLVKVLRPAAVATSTASFYAPAPTHEEAVGLERFEHASVETRLTTSGEVIVGEELDVRLDLVNVSRTPGLLVRIEDVIPQAFKAAALPSNFSVRDASVDVKGMKLEPLKVESIKLALVANEVGICVLSPQVVYVDEVGKFRTCRPEPVRISVLPKLTFEFRTETAKDIFNYLISAFAEDYMKRRMPLEKSGWRTLMQIVKDAKVTKSSAYAASGGRGRAVSELERRGLVEIRVFSGERGRGGKILKARICYDKETVKRYIDLRIMKK